MRHFARPRSHDFDRSWISPEVSGLEKPFSPSRLEELLQQTAIRILTELEGFQRVERGPSFAGTPFDFFGHREGAFWIVELKASLDGFNGPDATQKARLVELLAILPDLQPALLQVNIKAGQYKLWRPEQFKALLQHRAAGMEPILRWLNTRLYETSAESGEGAHEDAL